MKQENAGLEDESSAFLSNNSLLFDNQNDFSQNFVDIL